MPLASWFIPNAAMARLRNGSSRVRMFLVTEMLGALCQVAVRSRT